MAAEFCRVEKIITLNQTYRIFQIRGLQVMLDKDLANWYGTETKRLIEQVKRNIDRFPPHFMFQLTDDESAALRSQIATLNGERNIHSKRGLHSKYNAYVFTEHGVAMLSSVIHSKAAIQVNIQIINTFITYRSGTSSLITNNIDKESLAVFRNQLNEHENKIQLLLDHLHTFQFPKQGIFFDNQYRSFGI